MLFSPTIGAAITAGYWFLRARCPACRTTGDVDLRMLDWHRGAAVTALTPRRRADPAGRMRRLPNSFACRSRALPRSITQSAAATGGSTSEAAGAEAAEHSAGMPRVLRWARALPSLRVLLLHRHLATVDEQAIAFSLALAAYSSVSQSRTTARLARRRQFFIHLVRDLKMRDYRRWAVHRGHLSGRHAHPPANVPARDKLPKGLHRPVRREGSLLFGGAKCRYWRSKASFYGNAAIGPLRAKRRALTLAHNHPG